MVDAIDRDPEVDFHVMMLPPAADSKYQLNMTEDELDRAIGHTVRNLFTLLNYTQPKAPQLVGVVVIKEKVEPEEDKVVALPVITKESDPVVEEEVPVKIDLPPPPVEEKVEIILPPKEDREHVVRLIEGYREQIRILRHVVADERQLLRTQEQIQLLQQVNRTVSPHLVEARKERLQKIELFERQILEAQEKMAALQQTLQDI